MTVSTVPVAERAKVEEGHMPKRILAVDDESIHRRFLQQCLQDKFEVEVAASAEECLELLKHRQYDLLLTDCNMPGMNGYELVLEVHRRYPHLPCMMVSGSVYDIKDLLNQHKIPHLPKPYDPLDLVRRVQTILETAYLSHTTSPPT